MTSLEINGEFTDLTIKIDGTIVYDLINPTPTPEPTPTPVPTPEPTPAPTPDINKPVIISVSPSEVKRGIDTTITLTGSNFSAMAATPIYFNGVKIGNGYNISRSPTQIVLHDTFKNIGTYQIKVINQNGAASEYMPISVIQETPSPTPVPTPQPTPTPKPSGDMTLEELAKNPNLVAIDGDIYKMSNTGTTWKHNGHIGGLDLSNEFLGQHSISKLSGKTIVGKLVASHPTPTPTPEPTPTPIPEPGTADVLYFYGDAEPTNTTELIKDFNAAFSLSPTEKVSAGFAMGDMTKDTGGMTYTIQALNGSLLKEVQAYFVIGNHEYNDGSDCNSLIQAKKGAKYPLNYFPGDSSKNTYSLTIGNMHIAVLNIYYNNSTGKVSQAMFDWLKADMAGFTGYKIVIAHDPMYPKGYHEGNSLDADKAMRDKLQAMFIANKVNVFLGGHVHFSTVQNIGGVYHVCTGVIGPGTSQGEDNFASLNYIYVNEAGELKLVRKQDSANSWTNPKIITHTIGTPT